MKAMILAAGKGERMRPLTNHTPKPLLTVANIPLIEHHVRNLVKVGIKDIVINVSWLGDQIIEYLGDGHHFGANIQFSIEPEYPLETAGGITKALPLLTNKTDDFFLVVNGDVYTDFNFALAKAVSCKQDSTHHNAFLWLVENPSHNKSGDFSLLKGKVYNLTESNGLILTFSGIGLYRPSFFDGCVKGQIIALGNMLKNAVQQGNIGGEKLSGVWSDIGTPERLAEINKQIEAQA